MTRFSSRVIFIASLVALVLLNLLAVSARAVENTSPGKMNAFASTGDAPLEGDPNIPTLSVTIDRGKPRSVLTVEVTVDTNDAPQVLHAFLLVNGFLLFRPIDLKQGCTEGVCSLGGTFWVDLDDPPFGGSLVGQPLNVNLYAWGSGGSPTASAQATMVARLERKK